MKLYTPLILSAAIAAVFPVSASAQAVETTPYGEAESTPEFDRPDSRRALAELRGTVQARPISLLFTSMDRNFDKSVTRDEVLNGITAEWSQMEPSISGKVNAIKFSIWIEQTLGSPESLPSRLSFDADLDNQVSRDEFSSRILASFDGLDADKDNILSRSELVYVAPRGARPQEQNRRERPARDQTGQRRQRR